MHKRRWMRGVSDLDVQRGHHIAMTLNHLIETVANWERYGAPEALDANLYNDLTQVRLTVMRSLEAFKSEPKRSV